MRFFDSRAESDEIIDMCSDPDRTIDKQIEVASGAAGSTLAYLLGLRVACKQLEEQFGGGSGNEVHDIHNITRMREPMARLNLAIAEVMEGAKDIAWSAEVCTCTECTYNDIMKAAKFN